MKDAVFIGLGSNLGDRMDFLRQAVSRLQARGGRLLRASAVYETPPWGFTEQPTFYNMVIALQSNLTPLELLQTGLSIEQELGRVRQQHWGPRQIDIDLLAFGPQILISSALHLPHPHLQARAFVLKPWVEIAADWVVPALGQTVHQLLQALPASEVDAIQVVGALEGMA